MKKFLLAFATLVFLGAGCIPGLGKTSPVEGKWALAFDLPQGWIMASPYDVNSKVPISQDVKRDDSSVVVQSTDKKLCYGGITCEDATAVKPTDKDVKIYVTQIDSHRVVPKDNAEDLGNHFSRVKICEDNEDCRIYNAGNYKYYLETDGDDYEFTYNGDTASADRVIRSAKVVTKFTDRATVEVKTE